MERRMSVIRRPVLSFEYSTSTNKIVSRTPEAAELSSNEAFRQRVEPRVIAVYMRVQWEGLI